MSSAWIADAAIGLSYICISLVLLALLRQCRTTLSRLIVMAFAMFIISCGGGHLIDAWFEYNESCAAFSYYKQAWNCVTAILSVASAILLVVNAHVYIAIGVRIFTLVDIEKRVGRMERLERIKKE